jgi:probable rRNA maturation factor
MTEINVYRPRHRLVHSEEIETLIKKVVRNEHYVVPMINVIITNGKYLRKLNKEFLGRDRSTNVMSFNLGKSAEIYISKDKVRDRFDLHYYIVHGLLHLIGYDHRTKDDEELMDKKCREYIKLSCE